MPPHLTIDDVRRGAEAAGMHLDSIGKGAAFAGITPEEWVTAILIAVNTANESVGQRMVAAWTTPVGADEPA